MGIRGMMAGRKKRLAERGRLWRDIELMKNYAKYLVLAAAASAAAAEPLAFPGAEGFGAQAKGGRGGRVLFVTNLNDAGPGSFREACLAKGPRMVVFKVAGLIDLKKSIAVTEPYLTIAGQSAPGDGICLRGNEFDIRASEVIVRFLRARPGDIAGKEVDAINVGQAAQNVILDHCSANWSVDECLSPSGDIANVTVQWCIIGEALNNSVHKKGAHGYGSLARGIGGITFHHNLWLHNTARNPRMGDDYGKLPYPTFDVRNNVIYDWGGTCSGLTGDFLCANYVGNYLRPGPSSGPKPPISLSTTARVNFHVEGNVVEGKPEYAAKPETMFNPAESGGHKLFALTNHAFAAPAVRTTSAEVAYKEVLAQVGAVCPVRDAVDARLVREVETRTGRIINSQKEVGGWPEYRSGAVPQDTDGDGIPDAWEVAHGLNPKEAKDGAAVDAREGYTNVERYLNELAETGRKAGNH